MFSVIFQGFGGQDLRIVKAFREAFGGVGCFGSLSSNSAAHTPCELAANLTREEAERKAAILRGASAQVVVVLTAEVAGVKHRAAECWSTHQAANGEGFAAWDSFVVSGALLGLKERIKECVRSYQSNPIPSYEFELSYNHEHPTNTLTRWTATGCGWPESAEPN